MTTAAATTAAATELLAHFIPTAAREPLERAREILARYDQLDEAVKRVEAEARDAKAALPAARERLATAEVDIDVGQALEASGINQGADVKALIVARTRLGAELRELDERSHRAARVRDGVNLRRVEIVDELNAAAPEIRSIIGDVRNRFTAYVAQLVTSAIGGDGSLIAAAAVAVMGHHAIGAPDHLFLRHFCLPDPTAPITDFGDSFGPSAHWLLNVRGGKLTVGGRSIDWRDDAVLAQLAVEFRAIRDTADKVERVLRDAERRIDHAAAQAERARLTAAMDAGQRVVVPHFADLPPRQRPADTRPVQRARAWAGAAPLEDQVAEDPRGAQNTAGAWANAVARVG